MHKRQQKNDKNRAFFGHQFCILNPLIPILCVLSHLKWVRNMEKTVDNPGVNRVIYIEYIGVLGIFAKKFMEKIPDSKCISINWYFTGLFMPKESKMLTLANSDYLPQRDLRIWLSAKSGL